MALLKILFLKILWAGQTGLSAGRPGPKDRSHDDIFERYKYNLQVTSNNIIIRFQQPLCGRQVGNPFFWCVNRCLNRITYDAQKSCRGKKMFRNKLFKCKFK